VYLILYGGRDDTNNGHNPAFIDIAQSVEDGAYRLLRLRLSIPRR